MGNWGRTSATEVVMASLLVLGQCCGYTGGRRGADSGWPWRRTIRGVVVDVVVVAAARSRWWPHAGVSLVC